MASLSALGAAASCHTLGAGLRLRNMSGDDG
jgi:hypothetical protein